jgi:hypothetical protein
VKRHDRPFHPYDRRSITVSPRHELAGVVLARDDDGGDLRVAVVEDLAQQERGPLLGRQALEQHRERQGQRVRHLGMVGRVAATVVDQRLGQPFAHVALTSDPTRSQLVDAIENLALRSVDHGRVRRGV